MTRSVISPPPTDRLRAAKSTPRSDDWSLKGHVPAGNTPVGLGLMENRIDLASSRSDGWSLSLQNQEKRFLGVRLAELTHREREIVFEVCAGGTNSAIADRLCVALPTLRTHLMRLNQKLGTTSKSDVVRFVANELLQGYRYGEIIPDVR